MRTFHARLLPAALVLAAISSAALAQDAATALPDAQSPGVAAPQEEGGGIEGSVTNLTDRKYGSTIGSNGDGSSGDNQTLFAGAPRQFFVTLRGGF